MEQGSVLRQNGLELKARLFVSIPLEQGSVLRLFNNEHFLRRDRLNPFGTGQCLTTKSQNNIIEAVCLNPFGTGQCLTTKYVGAAILAGMSQSLWNRAVSYDCSGVIKPCATRLTEATSQLFPRLRELGLDLAKC